MWPPTTVWFGPPGTGKTTTLVDLVVKAVERGVSPNRIAYLAFTRAAAGEARQRVCGALGLEPDDLPWFRTLHSVAARLMGIRGGDLLEREDWQALGDALSMTLVEPDDEAGRWWSPSGDWRLQRGRAVQAIHGRRRAMRRPMGVVDLTYDHGREMGRLVDLYHRTLAQYKADTGLLDYGDLIEFDADPLPVDLAVIDEAQDLTPVQWLFAERVVAAAAELHVAGDDDQAVYEWAGADASRMVTLAKTARRHVVLEQSYRLPRAVFQVVTRISDRIRVRQPKTWTPRGDDGLVTRVAEPDHVDLADSDWLLTARTRRGLSTWEQVCRRQGIRYMAGGRDSVVPDEVAAIRTWERARAGKPVDPEAFDRAVRMTHYAPDQHPEMIPADRRGLPIWHQAMAAIPPARRQYYEACLRRSGRALSEAPRVLISTIHGSKGRQATRSAVLTDMPMPSLDALRRGGLEADAEHRVWYVATSRAKEELHLVSPGGSTFYDLGVYKHSRLG